MNRLWSSTHLVLFTGLALGLWGTSVSWAEEMEMGKTTTVEVSAEENATPVRSETVIELNREVHFLTPQGEDVTLPAGTYHVETAESWLKLVPKGKVRSAMILIEATQGSHEEELTKAIVRAEPDKIDSDILHLAVLLPDGTGLETVGSSSGIHARSSKRVFLKKLAQKPRKPRTLQRQQFAQQDSAVEREII